MAKFSLPICNDSLAASEQIKEDEKQLGDMWQDIQGVNHWKGLLDPINPFLKAEILRYGDFAQKCYDSFDNSYASKYYGNCKRSKSSLLHGLCSGECGRGYQVSNYIYPNTAVLNSLFHDKSSAWIGFIAVCTDPSEIKRLGRRDIVVAWRGTETPQEWLQNLRDILVPATLSRTTECRNIQTTSIPDVRIEKGFLSCYTSGDEDSVRCRLSAREMVVGEIKRLLNQYKDQHLSLTFTGHSLGAALATLSAYDVKQIVMKEYGNRSITVTVFAFASPRVGNLSFARHMEEIGVRVLRIVNKKDLVPKVPGVFVNENLGFITTILYWLPWSYVHVGIQITLDSSSSPLLKRTYSPASFHNLEVYLHLLDGFQVNSKLPLKPSGRDPALVNKNSDLLLDKLQIPSHWWARRNKEVVKRIDGLLVYSPTTRTAVSLHIHSLYSDDTSHSCS